jgi:hypothetical protein
VTAVIQYAALTCVAVGLISGVLALTIAHDVRVALRIALDFWLAAGLLRLVTPSGGEQLLAAAAIIAIRQLVSLALRHPPEPGHPPSASAAKPRRT